MKDGKLAVPSGRNTCTRAPRVRDRIFSAACELFYRQGIRAVGVHTIADEAGTNKMSFYRSFASKDELVEAYVKDRDAGFWAHWEAMVGLHQGQPRKQLEALVDALTVRLSTIDSCGRAMLHVAVELRETNHPAYLLVRETKKEIRRRLHELARDVGARDPEELGDALFLLIEGGHSASTVFCASDNPFSCAPRIARRLIEASLAPH